MGKLTRVESNGRADDIKDANARIGRRRSPLRIAILEDSMRSAKATTEYLRQISKHLEYSGCVVTHACVDQSHSPGDLDLRIMEHDQDVLTDFLQISHPNVIWSASSAFSFMLPTHGISYPIWCWSVNEFGGNGTADSEKIVRDKWPFFDGVLFSYELELQRFGVPGAKLLPLTVRISEDFGPKSTYSFAPSASVVHRLRFGTSFCDSSIATLKERLKELSQLRASLGCDVEVCALVGKHHLVFESFIKELNITVSVSDSRDARLQFFRSLDVYCPLETGVNADLEILEACSVGTAVVSSLKSRQPEICPFFCETVRQLGNLLTAYQTNSNLLQSHSKVCQRFAQQLPSFSDLALFLLNAFGESCNSSWRVRPEKIVNREHAVPVTWKSPVSGIFRHMLDLSGRDFASQAYRLILRREIDEGGMYYYETQLARGESKEELLRHMLDSQEFRSKVNWRANADWLLWYLERYITSPSRSQAANGGRHLGFGRADQRASARTESGA